MFEINLPTSRTSGALDNVDPNLWTGIIRAIGGITALVVQDASQHVVDHVTVIRGYAELSVMYPTVATYRERLSASLVSLAETFRADGELTFGAQVNSLADRCRKFDSGAFKADSSPVVSAMRSEIQSMAATNRY